MSCYCGLLGNLSKSTHNYANIPIGFQSYYAFAPPAINSEPVLSVYLQANFFIFAFTNICFLK